MIFTSDTGEVIKHTINDFKSSGVALGMYNTDESIRYIFSLFKMLYDEYLMIFMQSLHELELPTRLSVIIIVELMD